MCVLVSSVCLHLYICVNVCNCTYSRIVLQPTLSKSASLLPLTEDKWPIHAVRPGHLSLSVSKFSYAHPCAGNWQKF